MAHQYFQPPHRYLSLSVALLADKPFFTKVKQKNYIFQDI